MTNFISLGVLLLGLAVLPEGGTPILQPDPIASMQASSGPDHQFKPISIEGEPFKKGIRCDITTPPKSPWDVQFQFKTKQGVQKNEILSAHFFARSISSEESTALIRPLLEKAGPPHDKSLSLELELSKEWKEYNLPFKANDNYGPGQASAGFHLGLQKQTVEIADFQIYSYGVGYDIKKLPSSANAYAGQEPNAPWRAEAEKRIEQIRKGDLKITVLDAAGKPASGAKVEIAMKRHAFGWGSAVVANRIVKEGPDNDRYREIIEKYFTRVVFENDLKWGNWENQSNRESTLKAAQWLRDRKIEIRGHCLIWPSWRHTPKDLKELADDKDKLRKRIDDHIRNEAETMKGFLVDWDVINETFDNNDVMKVLGDGEMIEWFKIARKADPNVRLYLNDYSILSSGGLDKRHQAHFEKTLRFLKDGGAPIGGIGIQSHFIGSATPPERMLSILDRFGKIGLPITITEHDISSSDDNLKADFTRDFLTTTFSHPSVVGILTWGFWEKSHWRPDAAYFDADWAVTPAGKVWIDLVTKKWWTHENTTADPQGKVKTRVFFGDYEITVSHAGRTKSVKKSISNVDKTLDLEIRL